MILKALLMGTLAVGAGAGIHAAQTAVNSLTTMEGSLASLTDPAVLGNDSTFNACVNAAMAASRATAAGQPAPQTPSTCPSQEVP